MARLPSTEHQAAELQTGQQILEDAMAKLGIADGASPVTDDGVEVASITRSIASGIDTQGSTTAERANKAAKEAPKKAAYEEERRAERERKIVEAVDHFNTTYGTNSEKLEAWQQLCQHMNIPPEPSVTKCKKALAKVFINIYDFVAAQNAGVQPKHFSSKAALRQYSMKKGKVFPIKRAKAAPILRCLLIDMFV